MGNGIYFKLGLSDKVFYKRVRPNKIQPTIRVMLNSFTCKNTSSSKHSQTEKGNWTIMPANIFCEGIQTMLLYSYRLNYLYIVKKRKSFEL